MPEDAEWGFPGRAALFFALRRPPFPPGKNILPSKKPVLMGAVFTGPHPAPERGPAVRALTPLLLAFFISLTGAGTVLASESAPQQPAPGTSEKAAASPQGQDSAEASPAKPPMPSVKPQGTPTASDEEFLRRVRTMEEQVTDLKEQVFRTRARLFLLQESILGGTSVGQGAKALLIHRNEMGGSFILESAAYALDGAPIFTKIDMGDGSLGEQEEIEIFNGRILPGQHQIVVQLQFRGHGFGVFKYLEGYKFKVQSSHTFDAEPGRVTHLKIVAFEQGNFTTDMKDRPAIRYEMNLLDDEVPRAGSASPKAPESGDGK